MRRITVNMLRYVREMKSKHNQTQNLNQMQINIKFVEQLK